MQGWKPPNVFGPMAGFKPSEDSWVSDYSLRNAPEIQWDYLDNLKT
jgi:hypothetical protein